MESTMTINHRNAASSIGGAIAAAILLFLARPAGAQEMHLSGDICKSSVSGLETTALYDLGVANDGAGQLNVICAMPAAQAVGNNLDWYIYVEDKSTTGAVGCVPYSINTDNTVAWTGPYQETGVAFVTPNNSVTTLTFRQPDGGHPATNAKQRHYVSCFLAPKAPGNARSKVRGIHLW
jgi:hypothetical protein